MGKIKMKRLVKKLPLIVYIGVFAFSSLLIGPSQTASAANGTNFALFVGKNERDTVTRTAIAEAWHNGNEYGDQGWKTLRIFAKSLFGKNKVVIPFNEEDTKQTACRGVGGCADREPVFSITYYCRIPSGNLSLSEPTGARAQYYRVNYGIALKGNGGDDGNAFIGRNTFNAYGGVLRTFKSTVSGNGVRDTEKTHDVTEHNFTPDVHLHGGSNLPGGINNGDKWGIEDRHRKCRPSPSVVGQMDMKNFAKLSTAKKRQFVNNPSNPSGGGGAAGPEDNELTDCDLKLSNPLSWILCPIIDLGANSTDWLFQNAIEPLLSDIPLSVNPENDFFKAWQGFRFIANIILIIGMLGIVYSMARGDR